ncbi:Thiamin biosynthesis lipoprotein ApbE [hydrothermal vent metagenome]|uniref:FAD:protein FMN transferase n=1 Tax=hydrothermal vent metagenome TaxID=652676 RepID=A0A3B0YR38_9ZZZZ
MPSIVPGIIPRIVTCIVRYIMQHTIRTPRLLLLLALSGYLLGCSEEPQEHHHSSLYFGTLIDITLYDVSPQTAQAAFTRLDADFARFHTAWSPWVAGSLRRTNTLIRAGRAFTVEPSIVNLLEQSSAISANTEHLFNPAIGQLIKLWQFHKAGEPNPQPPAEDVIQIVLGRSPQLSDLKKTPEGKMLSENLHVSLNFGAFAKGYAIDLEMQVLKEMGIHNAIINTGGDLKTIGTHGTRPWRIAIQHPRKKTWLAQIDTAGEQSVFTSGDYERFYLYKGKRYHHILDPRTGYPAQGTQSVTVLHTDSGLADAAATALFIAGPEHWMRIARKLKLKEVMFIDHNGRVFVTPKMHAKLAFNPQFETTIILTPPL